MLVWAPIEMTESGHMSPVTGLRSWLKILA